MKIKSYFARTVEDAMAMARQELGPEAMLVNSRRAALETRHLGDYEVVFASDVPAAESEEIAAAVRSAPPGVLAQPFGERLSAEVAELKKELEGMRRAFTRTVLAPAQWPGASSEETDAYALLAAAEVSPELARDIVQSAGSRLAPSPRPDSGALRLALAEQLELRVVAQPSLGRGEARPGIVALVGPPGAGKTTTLVKLAANYGLASRRPVLLLSMDTYRVAAADQLRSFAAILGVGFQVLETVTALAQTIEENRGKDLIFIDTPGFGFHDLDSASALARFLSTRGDIDTHLVVASSLKSADLCRVVDAFEAFRPQRLLFTKLDETGSYGPILNETVRTGKPLSFFTAGQRIPEDLEEASGGRLAELVLAGQWGPALAAA